MEKDPKDRNRRIFLGASAQALSGAALAAPRAGAEQSGPARRLAVVGYTSPKAVTVERVTYPARNLGTPIAANLFRPEDFDPAREYPAIVVTHPFGGVKEQTAGLYAIRLAEAGFVTLAYDATYQGESGGEPRLMEAPGQRLDDISSSIDFLVRQPWVDGGRIGSLGICAGGSYALCNASIEMRVKAVATVSLFELGEARREGMGTISYEERMKRLRDAAEARTREARGEPPRLAPVVPDSPAAFTEKTPRLYREGYEYYRTPRGRHPNSPNRYMLSSLPQQMAFFPFQLLDMISPRAVLLIAGSEADTKFWSEQAYQKCRDPRELCIIEGASHIDLYDRPQFVSQAVAKLAAFFGRYLGQDGTPDRSA